MPMYSPFLYGLEHKMWRLAKERGDSVRDAENYELKVEMQEKSVETGWGKRRFPVR